MIVTCQACSTRYLVDPSALGAAGRTVRCASCGHTWHQVPVEGEPGLAGLPLTPLVSAQTYRPTHLPVISESKRKSPWLALGWIALILAVTGFVTVAVTRRDRVVEAWPASARIYGMIGMPVDQAAFGLELRSIVISRPKKEGVPTLVVGGEVVNTSNAVRSVPQLRVTLRNAADKELQASTFSASRDQLLPGEAAPFETTITEPPADATSASVAFIVAE